MTEQSPAGITGQSPAGMTRRAAQGRATRDQLIEVATGLFAERGYEETSIEAVLAAAGVSRGALYHHFGGKDALFEAVLETVENGVTARLTAEIAGAPDAVSAVESAALAWIEMAGDPLIQRIILIDAPSVLGLERWRALNEEYSLGATRALLQAVADEGRLSPDLVAPFAQMLPGALDEAAMAIARADDRQAALETGRHAVRELLRRIFVG
jgi:AcrR family transcriptional regulator